MADVTIIGGGIIGLTTALELAGQGVSVRVLEKGRFAREASWAGAGMLPPGNPTAPPTPEAALRGVSASMWRSFSQELSELTGIDNGFRNCGALEVRLHGEPSALGDEVGAWQRESVAVEILSPASVRACEPLLSKNVVAAYRLPEFCQMRPPRHAEAVLAACRERGVDLVANATVVNFLTDGDRVLAVQTENDVFSGDTFCVCAGPWSARLLANANVRIAVRPIRGQIVQFVAESLPFSHVVQVGPRYLVPREDGVILVGSTEEAVGFHRANTANAVGELIAFAKELVPSLSEAQFVRAWS